MYVCTSVCVNKPKSGYVGGGHHINGCDFLAEFVELSLQNAVNMIALQSLEMQRCRHKTWLYYVTVEQWTQTISPVISSIRHTLSSQPTSRWSALGGQLQTVVGQRPVRRGVWRAVSDDNVMCTVRLVITASNKSSLKHSTFARSPPAAKHLRARCEPLIIGALATWRLTTERQKQECPLHHIPYHDNRNKITPGYFLHAVRLTLKIMETLWWLLPNMSDL